MSLLSTVFQALSQLPDGSLPTEPTLTSSSPDRDRIMIEKRQPRPILTYATGRRPAKIRFFRTKDPATTVSMKRGVKRLAPGVRQSIMEQTPIYGVMHFDGARYTCEKLRQIRRNQVHGLPNNYEGPLPTAP